MSDDAALRDEVRSLIMTCARLKSPPGDDQSLFRDPGGAGLDSIDVLELVVALEKNYGVVVQDWAAGRQALQSVSSIAEFIRKTGVPRR